MSVDVLREVFRLSQSKGVARNVLTVLADAAHPDGVTWLPIVPSKNASDPSKCITHRANASKRAVIDGLQALAEAGEIEVRQAQRGQSRFNVYRVVLGSIGATSIDYADMPFELDRPFSDQVRNLHLVRNEETSCDEVQFSPDEVQSAHELGADFVTAEVVERPARAGKTPPPRLPEASVEPSLQPSAADQDLEGPRPAADHPASEREISDVVLSLPNADPGSPKVVRRELANLPRSVLATAIEKTRARRGGVGLLIDFIRIARIERTAMTSARLAEEVGQMARMPHRPITTGDALLRDDPDRFVRILAPTMPRDLMMTALEGHDPDARLLGLYDRVRAGDEASDRLGTPDQERDRWVRAHIGDPDCAAVIDSWAGDAPPDEIAALHELVEQLRSSESTSTRKADAA